MAIVTVGLRVQMGHPVQVDGKVVAGEPWRFAFEMVCWLGLLYLAVKSPHTANVENVETP
ncbi:MAG: hypothetical protein ACYCW6_29230 [Candidatus Xenobia bacterium]